ncbi:diguanylate cyclase [Alteromonas sp. A079]|uniref:sensor domain-containing diguanylate cyclase n=1 Tax=Alteromonas sp. A079 TaxID=3410268 RepID=UPI003B9E0B04
MNGKSRLTGSAHPFNAVKGNDDVGQWLYIQINGVQTRCFIKGSVIECSDGSVIVYDVRFETLEDSHIDSSLSRHFTFSQLLATLSSKLINVQSDGINPIIDKSLAAFGEFCGVHRCYLFAFSADEKHASNTHEWVSTGVTPYKDELQNMPLDNIPFLMKILRRENVFKVNDVALLPEAADKEREEFERENIASILCIPVFVNGDMFGFVGCDIIGKPYLWQDYDVTYLTYISEMLGNTIENENNRIALNNAQQALIEANKKLERLANMDGLTGIANRRLFDSTLERDLARYQKTNKPLSLLLLDVDFFKGYNDTYGHVAGDEVLISIAETLTKSCTGPDDFVSRFGGEEFAVILPSTEESIAVRVAQRIVNNVINLNIDHEWSPFNQKLTVSIGVASLSVRPCPEAVSFIEQADTALYLAKSQGRNCVSVVKAS